MSGTIRMFNVGAATRASDGQKVSDVAAAADDRATEILCTPGSNLKTIKPLSEESATVNPGLLVVGHDTDSGASNAKVRVRPAHFQAGSDAYTIALSAKQTTALTSPAIASNSSGSTRTDLVYAQVSYGTLTTETVRQKAPTGGAPISVLMTTQKDMLVTIAVVADVAAGDPLASLPADDTVNGVYNFGLAALAIYDGFSNNMILQSMITPLWSRGFVASPRVHGVRPASFYTGAASERPGGALENTVAGAERWGGTRQFFAHLKMLGATALTLDDSIDWRNRFVWGFYSYLAAGTVLPIESTTAPQFQSPGGISGSAVYNGGVIQPIWTGSGDDTSASQMLLRYTNGTTYTAACLRVKTDGTLNVGWNFGATPIDGTNGDTLVVVVYATDQLVSGI